MGRWLSGQKRWFAIPLYNSVYVGSNPTLLAFFFINMLIELIPFTLFVVSILGLVTSRKNIIMMIICLELLLLSLVFHYLLIGWCNFGDFKSIVLGIIILTVGASESAIGLALAISYFKQKETK